MFDLKDQGGINIDDKSSVLDHGFWERVQFSEVGWELDDYPDDVDSKQNNSNMFEIPS